MPFPLTQYKVPYLNTDQMIEVDRAMVEDFGITLLQMMENAGRSLAYLSTKRFLDNSPIGKKIVLLSGPGGNGGGVMTCARHLHNVGADLSIYATKPVNEMSPAAAHQGKILQELELPIFTGLLPESSINPDLIIDGLIGYGLQGGPRGPAAEYIRWVNQQSSPVLSLDTPSGINTTTGEVYDPAVRADATMTLALPKLGMQSTSAIPFVGELYLADIGVPPELYTRSPLALHIDYLFASEPIIRIS